MGNETDRPQLSGPMKEKCGNYKGEKKMYLMQKILQAVDRICETQELADVCGQKSHHSQPVKITDAEHSGEQTQTMCDRRSHHSLPVEITDAKHW